MYDKTLNYYSARTNNRLMNTKKQRYNNLDGIRSFASVGIMLMHVKSNMAFEVTEGTAGGFIMECLIGKMGGFVQLFFILSGFSMCCGYYEKFRTKCMDLNTFYSRRYKKFLPFFMLLIILDLLAALILDKGIRSEMFYEVFADCTLMFGLFPASEISVIGVGWTLGVIFGFYLLFPFFVYLIWNKRRAWLSFFITLGINHVCSTYFLVEGRAVACSTVRWLCFFAAGGLIYLYRDDVMRIYLKIGEKAGSILSIVIVFAGLLTALLIGNADSAIENLLSTFLSIIAYSLVILGTIGPETKVWCNRVTCYIGKISFEIYLAHMMIYRMIEKVGVPGIFADPIANYLITCTLTIGGVILFASAYIACEILLKKLYSKISWQSWGG